MKEKTINLTNWFNNFTTEFLVENKYISADSPELQDILKEMKSTMQPVLDQYADKDTIDWNIIITVYTKFMVAKFTTINPETLKYLFINNFNGYIKNLTIC